MFRNPRTSFVIAASLTMLGVPVAAAQQSQNPQSQGSAQPAPAGAANKDCQIAEWLAADNYVESELAKWAKEKAKSDKVVDFAKTVSDDHQKATERLAKAAPGASTDLNENKNDRSGVGSPPRTSGVQTGVNTLSRDRSPEGFDVSSLKRKIAKKRVECLKKELGEYDGEKFDAAFLGYQLAQHQNLLATLEVMEGEATPSLKDAITENRKASEDHLERATKLMKDIDH